MSPPFDCNLFQFDDWGDTAFDAESMELMSDFWTQVEKMDMLPPVDTKVPPESDIDWSIMDPPEAEELRETKENIVNYDCMWAGSWETSVPAHENKFVPTDLNMAAPGQSLLKRELSPVRPDTPPSLDGDEAPQFRHAVDVAGTALRLLSDSAAVAADHSYSIARHDNLDCLGVQTPSDSCESEEEIDVVSLGTSTQPGLAASHVRTECLPRAPSAQDRQHLQRTMASAISPRPAPRKRLVPPPSLAAPGRRRTRGPGRRGRRSNTDTDSEAECPEIERRSIHNDMERLRRIGLKNLFDELKKQIPATRDKDRAPKVVILREAAALCRKLRQEDLEREQLRKQHNKLMTKLKKLRASLSMRYRPY